MKTARDHQLKRPVKLVVIKQSLDGQPFWPIPNPPPPTIDACCEVFAEYSVFSLPKQHKISRGDLLIDIPSMIQDSYWAYCSWCYLVEYVSIDNTSCVVIAKQVNIHDIVKLPDRIYLTNDDFIKLHKPNPIDDLDAFIASLTIKETFNSHPRFAILKQLSDNHTFWPVPSPLFLKECAHLVWKSMRYYLFCLFGQHSISYNDLLIDRKLYYYLVKQVSVRETFCFAFTESVDVVKLHDKIYLENDFIQLHKPKPIDDLAEFVASLTIKDVFANQWPSESNLANIYIFRDKDIIFYVGSSTNVYNRVRAHLGIKMRNSGNFKLYVLIKNNLPNSRNWNIDLYRVNSTSVGDLVRYEMQIIKRLCPIINAHGNHHPMPLPMRYKWHMDNEIDE